MFHRIVLSCVAVFALSACSHEVKDTPAPAAVEPAPAPAPAVAPAPAPAPVLAPAGGVCGMDGDCKSGRCKHGKCE